MQIIPAPVEVIDEDNMASNSATKVPTQQSVKAYVDATAGGFGEGAVITTQQSTSSTSFTDLATTGPTVVADVPASGAVLVLVDSQASDGSVMSFALSGANTLAASDDRSRIGGGKATGSSVLTGLTPGSTTFTAKYRATSGTVDFQRRSLVVIPLG